MISQLDDFDLNNIFMSNTQETSSLENSFEISVQEKLQKIREATITDPDDSDMSVDLFEEQELSEQNLEDDKTTSKPPSQQFSFEELNESSYLSFSFNENEIPIEVDDTEPYLSFPSGSGSSGDDDSDLIDSDDSGSTPPTQPYEEYCREQNKTLKHKLSDTDETAKWVIENFPDVMGQKSSSVSVPPIPKKEEVVDDSNPSLLNNEKQQCTGTQSPYFSKVQKRTEVSTIPSFFKKSLPRQKSLRGQDMQISTSKPQKITKLKKSILPTTTTTPSIPSLRTKSHESYPKETILPLDSAVRQGSIISKENEDDHMVALQNLLKQSNDCLALAITSKQFLTKTAPVAILAANLLELNKNVSAQLVEISKKGTRTPVKKCLIPNCPKTCTKRKRESSDNNGIDECEQEMERTTKKIKF